MLLWNCSCGRTSTEILQDSSDVRALNDAIEVVLDGPIDPLSVTTAGVMVRGADGQPLAAEMDVDGGRLRIHLVVTERMLSIGIDSIRLELAGLPSPSALATLDGRRLRASVVRLVPMRSLLRAAGNGTVRLTSVNGIPPNGAPVRVDGSLVLAFSGVVDPSTVAPEACPLFPVAGDIALQTPVYPDVRWRCVGERFEVELSVPPGSGPLQCALRRFSVRDLQGRPLEPSGLVIRVESR